MSNDVKVDHEVERKIGELRELMRDAEKAVGGFDLSGFEAVWKKMGKVLGLEVRERR